MTRFTVRPLTPDLLPDWLAFFDERAFADHPAWASCYCAFFHADCSGEEWEKRTAAENRVAASRWIRDGRLRGYLAYAGEEAVGWVHAAPRLLIPNLARRERLAIDDAEHVGSIVCFVIARPSRRQGAAARLLAAAVDGFRAAGLRVAEAYPRTAGAGDAEHFPGPLRLYLAAGFHEVREFDTFAIVRRNLRAAE
ncbi:MAG: GNAT family N-acetyltransferase [Planctomycetota bacterium]